MFWNTFAYIASFCMLLWVAFALAFGLIAKRCGPGYRGVSATAWLNCVLAAVVAGLWLLSVFLAAPRTLMNYSLIPISLTLIGFGVAAHQPFGWSWSIPSILAGLFLLITSFFGWYYISTIAYGSSAIGSLWLVPLFVLGIAMCRTRLPRPQSS